MTVDIAAVAEEARRVQVEPFGASVGHSGAAVWEKAARALAQERDALAAGVAEIAQDIDNLNGAVLWDVIVRDLRTLLAPKDGAP